MKLIIQILLVCCLSNISYGQLQNANWCFGTRAKLGFVSTPPNVSNSQIIPNLTYGGIDAGSVSDKEGNLLFYTNGKVVWGKNNVIMPNGSQLYTTETGWSYQFLSIVPKPNHPNLYYLFQLGCGPYNPHTLGHEGIYYSVIDMNLNNGNGDIVLGLKNIPLKNDLGDIIDYNYNTGIGIKPKFGEITSTLHKDGDKIWVSFLLTFDNANVPARYLYSFLVTEIGIHNEPDGLSQKPDGTTLLSNANYPSPNIVPTSYGQIKISPNGTLLCHAMNEAVNLYKFDNQNGTATFNMQLYTDNGNGNGSGSGVEFSPNSQLLYFTTLTNIYQQVRVATSSQNRIGKIYQHKIGSSTIEVIHQINIQDSTELNQNLLSTFPIGYNIFALQLALDGKIYFCSTYPAPTQPNQTRRTLGAIRQPNLISQACDVSINEITLNSVTKWEGVLPQWVHTTAGRWPKSYTGKYSGYLTKTNDGDIICTHFATMYQFNNGGSLNPNINHVGPLPLPPSVGVTRDYSVHYTPNGLTNWTKTSLLPLICLKNGILQMGYESYSSPGTLTNLDYFDAKNGSQVNGPSVVPPGERILAETDNGNFITLNGNYNLQIRSITGIGNSLATGISNYFYSSAYKFNPVSNKLFYLIYDQGYFLRIYSINGTNLTLINEKQLQSNSYPTDGDIPFVTENDEVYIVFNKQLYKLDYNSNSLNAIYNLVNIPSVTNSEIRYVRNGNPYVENKFMFNRYTLNPINYLGCYLFDFYNNTLKSIPVINRTPDEYIIDGDNVYLALHSATTPSFSVGNVQVNQMFPNFWQMNLFKFNLVQDFSRNANPLITQTIKSITTNQLLATISPNPSKNSISIKIIETKKLNTNEKYSLFFKNNFTNTTIVKRDYISGNQIDISTLQRGLNYIEIINSKGEKTVVDFLKL